MTFSEHLEIGDWNGQCFITVWDMELFDFLDDLFVEASLEPWLVQPPDQPGQLRFLFPAGVTRAAILRLLTKVGPEEIERIVRINSGASPTNGV